MKTMRRLIDAEAANKSQAEDIERLRGAVKLAVNVADCYERCVGMLESQPGITPISMDALILIRSNAAHVKEALSASAGTTDRPQPVVPNPPKPENNHNP